MKESRKYVSYDTRFVPLGLDVLNMIILTEIENLSKLEKGCYISDSQLGQLIRIGRKNTNERINYLARLGYIKCDTKYINNKRRRTIKFLLEEKIVSPKGLSDIKRRKEKSPQGGSEEQSTNNIRLPQGYLTQLPEGNPGLSPKGDINKLDEGTKTMRSSGSDGLSTKVEVRPGNNNTGPNILGPDNKIEKDLQIVPHPSLRCGEVRDNKTGSIEDPKGTLSTNEKKQESFTWEYYNPRGGEISEDDKLLIEDLPNTLTTELKEIINDEYKEKIPNWESILFKFAFIRPFFDQTKKLVKPDVFVAEVINEYFKRIKRGNY